MWPSPPSPTTPTRLPFLHVPVAQRRVGGDARRRGAARRAAGSRPAGTEREALVDHDRARVAAVGGRLPVHLGAVVGERRALLAELLEVVLAVSHVRHESTMQPTPARSPDLSFSTAAPTGPRARRSRGPGPSGTAAPPHSSRTWWRSEWQTPHQSIAMLDVVGPRRPAGSRAVRGVRRARRRRTRGSASAEHTGFIVSGGADVA